MLTKAIAAILVLIVVLVGGWYLFIHESPTPIGKITDNPAEYEGKSLVISGTVKDIVSLVVVKYYILEDSTGEIRVVTKRMLPGKGASVTARGNVDQAFAIGSTRVLVFIEEE